MQALGQIIRPFAMATHTDREPGFTRTALATAPFLH